MGQDEEFLEVGGARVLKLLRHFMNAFLGRLHAQQMACIARDYALSSLKINWC